MRAALLLRTLGLLLMMFSMALIPPVLISLFSQDGEIRHFSADLFLTLFLGLLLWLPLYERQYNMRSRDGFVIVAMFWAVLGLLSSLPFYFGLDLDLANSVFESVSAFTTTGATVIIGLDELAPSMLFYRQELQWLGGIGVIVSAVAVLPMLGVGGMQLYRAETPGPSKEEKLTPRIAQTARSLWLLYGWLTIACALAFWLAGMTPFDAIAHSLATVSTGGFSTHDASLAYFNSTAIELVAEVFMLLGAINFGIHFAALHRRDPLEYWRNTEVRTFLVVVALLIIVIAAFLFGTATYTSAGESLRYAALQVVSVITSTGFTTANFSIWPSLIPLLLMFSSFMGGCAGSTSGGMKVIRFVVLAKQGSREIMRLIHPHMMRPLKIEEQVIPTRVVDAVRGFFALYVVVFVVILLLLLIDGMDAVSAFGAVTTCLNNLGPGLGTVSGNFVNVSDEAKWVLSLAMLLGRLELFTILVLLSPAFWRD